jgi:phosphoribosylformylglycinamidine synthase subunit PurQ / glutaminase
MSARIAVLIFPGTNSEEETLRVLLDCGAAAETVHWSRANTLRDYAAYVICGGFAYEDRVRAGAIAAHDAMMDPVIAGARGGKLVFGICNGAQILLEAGLVPGDGAIRRPTAAFTHNAPGHHFICKHVRIKLATEPARCAITAALAENAVIEAWAAHGEGRLAARDEELATIEAGRHVVFTYAGGAPNGSALDCAGLTNREGNVLAIMPHCERVHPPERRKPLFQSFVTAVGRG